MKKSIVLFIIFLFFSANTASAHDASLTYTTATVNDSVINVLMTTPYNNITGTFPKPNKTIDEIDLRYFLEPFSKGFIIENDGKKCNPLLISVKNITDI